MPIRRLIWGFAGRTYPIVGNLMSWLIFSLSDFIQNCLFLYVTVLELFSINNFEVNYLLFGEGLLKPLENGLPNQDPFSSHCLQFIGIWLESIYCPWCNGSTVILLGRLMGSLIDIIRGYRMSKSLAWLITGPWSYAVVKNWHIILLKFLHECLKHFNCQYVSLWVL